jgi:hypothetical protein
MPTAARSRPIAATAPSARRRVSPKAQGKTISLTKRISRGRWARNAVRSPTTISANHRQQK